MLPNTVTDRFWKEGNLMLSLLCVRLITCLLWSLHSHLALLCLASPLLGMGGQSSLEACRGGGWCLLVIQQSRKTQPQGMQVITENRLN